jgi:chromosome partitioning protein
MGLVIAVANQKGGVGKTTTTMNLAGVFQSEGYKVYVADADGQQSCMSWCAAAGPETPLPFRVGSIHRLDKMIGPEIAALANDYDDCSRTRCRRCHGHPNGCFTDRHLE